MEISQNITCLGITNRVLHEVGNHVKLKELTVAPKTCLSMQRHDQRAEFWFVAEGEATVYTVDPHSTDRDLMASPATASIDLDQVERVASTVQRNRPAIKVNRNTVW
jgi:hypothetical protein